jgi:hypothetical protein
VTATADTGSASGSTPEPLVHQHEWRLVAVEYDDLHEVRELRCEACDLTSYA